MSPIKKTGPIPTLIERDEAVDAFKIILFERKYNEITENLNVSQEDWKVFSEKLSGLINDFEQKYKRSHSDVINYFLNQYLRQK